jgi:hypothetical protein
MATMRDTPLGINLKRVKALKTEDLFKEVFTRPDVARVVVELNRLRLQKGLTTQNRRITNLQTGSKAYTKVTEAIYKKIGRRIVAGSNYTMKYRGDFYNSIRVNNVTGFNFDVLADPIKDDGTNLYEVYGQFLIGATPEDLDVLRAYVLPIMQNITLRYLITP